ncbi:MAG: hypothetical protein WBO08_05575 [Mycobacterium sp.]
MPWADSVKGQRKDDVMHEYLASPALRGVLFIGRAQEKTNLFRTEKRHDARGDSCPWIVKTTGVVNRFYFYCLDADFGPFFLKFCSYFPCNAELCLNGNEWAKRQAAKAGSGGDPDARDFGIGKRLTNLLVAGDRLHRHRRPCRDHRHSAGVALCWCSAGTLTDSPPAGAAWIPAPSPPDR